MQARHLMLITSPMADSPMPAPENRRAPNVLVVMVLLAVAGLVVALLSLSTPQNLKNIGGYAVTSKSGTAWDMKTVLQGAIDRKQPLTLTERHINLWLARTLTPRQGGFFSRVISLDRVWIRLEDKRAEVIQERRIFGQPFTVSMFLKVEQSHGDHGALTQIHLHGGPYFENLPQVRRGGRFGNLVVPQGFLLAVIPSYQKLARLFSEEIHLGLEEMAHIQIAKGRLILDPRHRLVEPPTIPSGTRHAF